MEIIEYMIRGEENMKRAFEDYANRTSIDIGPQKAVIIDAQWIDDGELGLLISLAPLKSNS